MFFKEGSCIWHLSHVSRKVCGLSGKVVILKCWIIAESLWISTILPIKFCCKKQFHIETNSLYWLDDMTVSTGFWGMSGKCGGNSVDKSLDKGVWSKKDLIDLNHFGTTPCVGIEYTLRSLNVNK